jgi:hypothetical protein
MFNPSREGAMWPEVRVRDWKHFTDVIEPHIRLVTSYRSHWVFRGQADAGWLLEPSIDRVVRGRDAKAAIYVEKAALAEFRRHAHLYLSGPILPADGSKLVDWWTIMQHHRAPTRLLDWSASPYVAAYFAVEDHWSTDGVIWGFERAVLRANMEIKHGPAPTANSDQEKTFWEADSPPQVTCISRAMNSERMMVQQGMFTICRRPLTNHADAISDLGQPPTTYLTKIIIPHKLKPDFLLRLRVMNINANALFPGMDGIGRSVSELVRLI